MSRQVIHQKNVPGFASAMDDRTIEESIGLGSRQVLPALDAQLLEHISIPLKVL
jgi:hypothetical protein